jgi:uncharacterized oligopeptide transporter (OPT) family protein
MTAKTHPHEPAPKELTPKELTWRGVALGALLTVIFTAANVYLGLRIGLTLRPRSPRR